MDADNIKTICALGTGAMGTGTAVCFAVAGYEDVRLWAHKPTSIEPARKEIDRILDFYAQHNLIQSSTVPVIKRRIQITNDVAVAARDAHFVMESLPENLETKREYFGATIQHCSPQAVLASNTSGLSLASIAEGLVNDRGDWRGNLLVTHMFNPPHLMTLVEIVRGHLTSDQTIATATEVMKKIGKAPIMLEFESPGFVVNVVQVSILAAACELVERGIASPQAVDAAIERDLNLAGMDIAGAIKRSGGKTPVVLDPRSPTYIADYVRAAMLKSACELVQAGVASPEMIDHAIKVTLGLRLPDTGPFRSADMTGHHVLQAIYENIGMPVPRMVASAVQDGNLGVKTGQGLYEWSDALLGEFGDRRALALVGHMKGKAELAPVRGAGFTAPGAVSAPCVA